MNCFYYSSRSWSGCCYWSCHWICYDYITNSNSKSNSSDWYVVLLLRIFNITYFFKFIYLVVCRHMQCYQQVNWYVNNISSILCDINIFSIAAPDCDKVSKLILYNSAVYIVNKFTSYFLIHLCKQHIFLYIYSSIYYTFFM